MLRKTLLLAASGVLGLVAPAHAHNAWLLPSITVVADTNQSITVDAGTSTAPFEANHNAMNIDAIKVWAADGTMGKIENPSRGRYRSTFDVRIDKPGTWRIGLENANVSGTFKVDGEAWAVGRRRFGGPGPQGQGAQGQGAQGQGAQGAQVPQAAQAMAGGRMGGPGAAPAPGAATPAAPGTGGPVAPGGQGRPIIDAAHTVASVDDIPANATDLDLTESFSRNEFFVTAGAPTEATFRPTNKGLEFVPVTLPNDLVSNEPGKFRFLVDGKPAAGLKVEVIPGGRRFRQTDETQQLTTDATGTVTIKWPVAGFYWLSTSTTDDKPANPRATKRRMIYIATLEVVAP
jgi:uncharacterized GH25 family protein